MFWDTWPLDHQTEGGCVPYRKEIFSLSRQRRNQKELVTLTRRCRKSRALNIPIEEFQRAANFLMCMLRKLWLPETFHLVLPYFMNWVFLLIAHIHTHIHIHISITLLSTSPCHLWQIELKDWDHSMEIMPCSEFCYCSYVFPGFSYMINVANIMWSNPSCCTME